MKSVVLISIIGPDRIGLVSAVTCCLYDLGVNLGDTTFAVLGKGFEFTSLVELPKDIPPERVQPALAGLPELEGATVDVKTFGFDTVHGASGRITHRIEVSGGDRPGIIARLAEVFADFGANIVRMNSRKVLASGGTQYVTRFAVFIPEDRSASCLATVANTVSQLHLKCSWEQV